MLWAALTLFAAILDAGYYALVKQFLPSLSDEVLAAATFLSASALLLGISLVNGIPPVSPVLLPSVLITGTVNIIAALLVFSALRRTDLSLAVPLITFTLVFLMGTSWLVLGEVPTAAGAAGILLIVAGSLVMQIPAMKGWKGKGEGHREKRWGILAMLLVAFLYSISLPFDKAVVLASDPVFGTSLVYLYIGAAFLALSVVRGSLGKTPRQVALRVCLLLGPVLTLEAIAINLAFTVQIVPFVIAVKRLSILFAVLFGGLLFHEGEMRFRIIGACIMIAGAVAIVLSTVP
jgi:drug/metabolite transporter (DMT)-like permease